MRTRALTLAGAALLTACGGGTGTSIPTSTSSAANRPATSAQVSIVSPSPGALIRGNTVHVAIALSGATITRVYSTTITPTLGHIHLYLDNQLIYMNYTLQQDVTVHPGLQYSLYAEFVASDHFPFHPRDVTNTIFFSVAPS